MTSFKTLNFISPNFFFYKLHDLKKIIIWKVLIGGNILWKFNPPSPN